MSQELKPCPFCGGTKIHVVPYRAGFEDFAADVSCHTCGAKVLKVLKHTPDVDEEMNPSTLMEEMLWDDILEQARDEAVTTWNTRVFDGVPTNG